MAKALRVAELPQEIVGAFRSPVDIQFRWAVALDKAYQQDPDAVLSAARLLAGRSPKPPRSRGGVALPMAAPRPAGQPGALPRAADRTFELKSEIHRKLLGVLDRLVGYKISPLLWDKVRRGLSAGRVQTVALRLIVDRERAIEAFTPQEYWSVDAELTEHGYVLAPIPATSTRPGVPTVAFLAQRANQHAQNPALVMQ